MDKVVQAWQNADRRGDPMYVLWAKFKQIKPVLKGRSHKFSKISSDINHTLDDLEGTRKDLSKDASNDSLRKRE